MSAPRPKVIGWIIVGASVTAAVFHLYAAGFSPFTALVQRPVHLALMATLGFLGVGVQFRRSREKEGELDQEAGPPRIGPLNYVLAGLSVLACLYLASENQELVSRSGNPTLLDLVAGGVMVVLVLELARRATGWGLVTVCIMALVYAVSGRTRGGPAKTAAVASAFMGSLSGSAVANVVTTGTFTIPLMKRAGFRPFFAGAIEAAASTGGQLMPPVMGAGAFILATWTNIPYLEVAAAAVIPAILYYAALLAAIHFRASAMGIEPVREVTPEKIRDKLHLLLPLGAIVLLLAMGRSPMRAAFWGVTSALVMACLRPATRPSLPELGEVMERAGRGAVQVAAACAAAGVVVGVASLTGIGLRMSELIETISGGNLLAALMLTAIGSIILGMGLPTTAAYVVLAALGAPALVQLGVPLLAAHLFIFYFGCISNVTPPVSLAAFAAAGISGSPALKTAVSAALLAGAGFVVPFMFVYGPELLLIGNPVEIMLAFVTGLLGVIALASAGMGYARRPLRVWERAIALCAALLLVAAGLPTDIVGLLLLAFIFTSRR